MVRCAECGYKNSPVYHYCGVCGAVLHPAAEPVKAAAPVSAAKAPAVPVPPVAATPPPAPVAPSVAPVSTPPPPSPIRPEPTTRPGPSTPPDSSLSGMSFLGLSQPSSSSSPSYLLEDEEPPKRTWGRFVFIVLLLAVAGGLAWQWKHGGYPFVRPQQAATVPAQPTQNPAPTPDTTQPVPNTPLITAADTPSNQPGTPEATPAQPAAAEPAKPADTKPDTSTEAKSAEPKPTEAKPAGAKPEAPAPTTAKAQPPAVTKPATPAEPPVSPGESLFRQGQKYLYGTGAAANCDLAQKSLMAAAARNHVQAQSTLGTMYFTGHCVNRDLPTAYRWFAKALKQDPTNTRLEQNLSVVWRQMTAEEQKVAMQAQ